MAQVRYPKTVSSPQDRTLCQFHGFELFEEFVGTDPLILGRFARISYWHAIFWFWGVRFNSELQLQCTYHARPEVGAGFSRWRSSANLKFRSLTFVAFGRDRPIVGFRPGTATASRWSPHAVGDKKTSLEPPSRRRLRSVLPPPLRPLSLVSMRIRRHTSKHFKNGFSFCDSIDVAYYQLLVILHTWVFRRWWRDCW